MLSLVKNEYGIHNGNLVHVSQVNKGLSCDCICPYCKSTLIAKKGKQNSYHFAHYKSSDCGNGYETALHILAKDILKETTKILGPDVYIGASNIKLPTMSINYDTVMLEYKLNNIIADLVVLKNNKPLIIEIFVTHKIDDIKFNKIKELNLSTLEIDLSKLDRVISKNELRDILLYDTKHKKWIYNKPLDKLVKANTKLLASLLTKYKIHRGNRFWNSDYILKCPKEKRKNWRTSSWMNEYGEGCATCEYFQGYIIKELPINPVYLKSHTAVEALKTKDGSIINYSKYLYEESNHNYNITDNYNEYVYCGYINKIKDYNSFRQMLSLSIDK